MNILAEKMLGLLALLVLAASVSDGQLINKCKLRDQLNQILPANTMGRVNKVAKIVCHVELSTGFNTKAISQITAPAIYTSRPYIGRRGRSILGSSSEESSEYLLKVPRLGFPSSTPQNATSKQNTTAAPNYTKPFPGNEGKNNGRVPNFPERERGHGGRRGRSAPGSSHKKFDEKHGNKPKSDSESHSATPKMVTSKPNNTEANFTQAFPGNGSYAANATQNSGTGKGPKIINPRIFPKKGRGHGGRWDRSFEDLNNEESGQEDIWTLYGLFQLPDRIACISGGEQSLNLCNMACNKLIDDDIRDDLACLGTIIRKALSGGRRPGPTDEFIKIYYAGLFEKKCSNVVASKYFSTC